MVSQSPQFDNYLDILYLNRNKYYGGYALRIGYPLRAKKALASVMSAVTLFIVLHIILNTTPSANNHVSIYQPNQPDTLTYIPVEKWLPSAPLSAPAAQTSPSTTTFNPTVGPDILTKPKLEINTSTDAPDSALFRQEGEHGDGSGNEPNGNNGAGDKEGQNKQGITPASELHAVSYAEEMPEFPGGMDALQKFLQKHLQYPETARNADKEGVVVINFIIEINGQISEPKVIRKGGYGFDDEAIRVVKKMPLWKPGKMNGKAVNVSFNLPIHFQLD